MLDIHAPHESVHTWRDFFIHIATIVVGLLIAIGLEQTVEALHHSHQRHHLQEDLHNETARQHATLQNDLRTFAVERVWLLALRNDVGSLRSSGGKARLSYRPRPTTDPNDPNHKPIIPLWPSDAVWQTAKSSGLIYLLPPRQGELYTSIARQQDLFAADTTAWLTEQTALIAFETQFDDGTPSSTPDLSRMSAAQLDTYYAMLTRNLAMRDTIVNRTKIFDAYLTAILDGVTSRAEILPRILKEHPDLER